MSGHGEGLASFAEEMHPSQDLKGGRSYWQRLGLGLGLAGITELSVQSQAVEGPGGRRARGRGS